MTLREQLTRDEDRRHLPYRDLYGWLTIGVGRNLDAVGISDDEIDLMLDHDIKRAAHAVHVRAPWSDTIAEPRRSVLIAMAFNMGPGGLMGFKRMLAACEGQHWDAAAAEMLDSRWAGQVGDRAKRLAQQMAQGEWV